MSTTPEHRKPWYERLAALFPASVRRAIYVIAAATVALAANYLGLTTDETALWLNLVAAVLGMAAINAHTSDSGLR